MAIFGLAQFTSIRAPLHCVRRPPTHPLRNSFRLRNTPVVREPIEPTFSRSPLSAQTGLMRNAAHAAWAMRRLGLGGPSHFLGACSTVWRGKECVCGQMGQVCVRGDMEAETGQTRKVGKVSPPRWSPPSPTPVLAPPPETGRAETFSEIGGTGDGGALCPRDCERWRQSGAGRSPKDNGVGGTCLTLRHAIQLKPHITLPFQWLHTSSRFSRFPGRIPSPQRPDALPSLRSISHSSTLPQIVKIVTPGRGTGAGAVRELCRGRAATPRGGAVEYVHPLTVSVSQKSWVSRSSSHQKGAKSIHSEMLSGGSIGMRASNLNAES
jgi:hypothetical protein